MTQRIALGAIATAAVLTLFAEACQPQPEAPAKAPMTTEAPYREATPDEKYACEMSTLRGEPPRTGDCSKVPNSGPIYEDDVYGRWDCATMGNRICGPGRN